MTKLALIDGDIILYSVGFASEERYYLITDKDDNVVQRCQYAKEANALLADNPDLTKQLHRDPVEHHIWKGNANTLINNIVDRSGCSNYRIYLTGEGNFRETLVDNYKANRINVPKPLMIDEMRSWLVDRHGAIVIDGREADDELATVGFNNPNAVICTIDKDLKMVPGWHYNWVKKELYEVDEDSGLRWFFQQVLMGDTADNIIGLKGVGPRKAEKALSEVSTAQEMYDVCVSMYLEKDRTVEDLETNGHLLWMQRTGTDCKWDTYLNIEKGMEPNVEEVL